MTRVTSRLSILLVLGLTVQGISEQDRDVQIRDRYLASALKNPRRGTALEKLYQLALQTDGVDALVEQIRQHDGAPAVARWTLIGLLEETRGRDKDALAAFDKAVEASAESHYPAYRRGVVLLHRNDYAAAEKSLLGAMKAGPPRDDAIEIQKALGRCYLRSRQMAKAHKTWSTLAEIAPDDPMTLEELTRILVEEEQWDEALKYYERLRELQKDRPYHAVLCTIAMRIVERRYNVLKKLGRGWEGLRYLLASSSVFEGFEPTPADGAPDTKDKSLGVKTERKELITSVHGWSHPDGSPNGLAGLLLGAAEEHGQLDGMREHLKRKLAEQPENLACGVWLAMVQARQGKIADLKERIPKLLKLAAKESSSSPGSCYPPILWLDEELERHPSLLSLSVDTCEFVADEITRSGRVRGVEHLLYYRLAARYGKAGRREDAKAVFLKLAELPPPEYYQAIDRDRQQLEYTKEAAQGLHEAGFHREACELAFKVVRRSKGSNQLRYVSQGAERLIERIRKEHPEIGVRLTMVACPDGDRGVRFIWSETVEDTQARAPVDGLVCRVPKRPELFGSYQAEIQIAAASDGTYRRLASVPAESQQYRHEGLPPNRLFWARLVLRDKDDRVVGQSEAVPVAAGKDLLADGGMERVPLGRIPAEAREQGRTWMASDLKGKPIRAFRVIENGCPFLEGSRCLSGQPATQPIGILSAPAPADPKKKYLYGAWCCVKAGAAGFGRVALDEKHQTLLVSEAGSIGHGEHWSFFAQRVSLAAGMNVTPGAFKRVRGRESAGMPSQQKYLQVGFQLQGGALFDGAFLIPYVDGEDEDIAKLPPAEKIQVHDEAAKEFGELAAAIKEKAEPISLLTAVPMGERSVQLLWSTQPERLENRSRDTATPVRIVAQSAVFVGYEAEIQVSVSEHGRYHVLARVPAERQCFVHEDAPPNALLWYRLLLREKPKGKHVALSRPIAAAAGNNLVPDGAVEADPIGPATTQTAAERNWMGVDLALKPKPGLAVSEGKRPFGRGGRRLRIEAPPTSDPSQLLMIASKPVPADPNQQYLIGAWVKAEKGRELMVGRLALDEKGTPLAGAESWAVSASSTRDWVCVTQRLSLAEDYVAKRSTLPVFRDQKGTHQMPKNQRYLRVGVGASATGYMDDAFLVAYKPARESLLAQRPVAEPIQIRTQANLAFRKRITAMETFTRSAHMIAAAPIAEDRIQLTWSTQPSRFQTRGNHATVAVRIAQETGVFAPYLAAIHVATREDGDYKLLAKVPASSQRYVHKGVPKNVLLWYRIALHDKGGRRLCTSLATPAATGKNLIPDAGMEEGSLGLPLLAKGNDSQQWQAFDAGSAPDDRLAFVNQSRPFSIGKRCLARGGTPSEPTSTAPSGAANNPLVQALLKAINLKGNSIFARQAFPLDPTKTYLYGAWLRTPDGAITMGRAALFEPLLPILISETITHRSAYARDWVCVTQRIQPNPELKPKPGIPPLIRRVDSPTQEMPANQKYVIVGFGLWRTGFVDDLFLIECRQADASVLESLPPVDSGAADVAAAASP